MKGEAKFGERWEARRTGGREAGRWTGLAGARAKYETLNSRQWINTR